MQLAYLFLVVFPRENLHCKLVSVQYQELLTDYGISESKCQNEAEYSACTAFQLTKSKSL